MESNDENHEDITKDFDQVRPADTANPILNAKIWRAKQELKKLENLGERPAPHIPREGSQYPVTDLKYYMDGYLRDNLNEVPKFLNKGWDCVIIVAGNAKVRIGKTLKKGSKVLMSDGSWKNVEDINIGDKVISPQKEGVTFEQVTELHNRFEEDCYDVIDESSGEILYSCAGNHDIPVYKNNLKKGAYEYVLMEAKEIAKFSIKNKNQFYTKSSPILEYEKSKAPDIDAYSLGAWLGDGSFTRQLTITTKDEEIINHFNNIYGIEKIYDKKGTIAKQLRFSTVGKFAGQLENLGLRYKTSGDKFIPNECLLSSKEFRINLLAGLIDTDGYCNKENSLSITTKSDLLAESIKSLVFSLGGLASIKKIKKSCNDFIGEYFNVRISFTDPTFIPLKLKYKYDRLRKSKFERRNRYIKCIKSSPSQVFGFSITGESKLHITDNWMITHNSTLAMQMAYYLAWLLNESRKKKKEIPPDTPVPFDNSNIAFSPDEVMKLATGKPKHSVLVYDEGRAGLDAAGAMQNINKTMTDFFQECGQYGHIIIIVLPDFFKLSEMIAIPRSLFLINVYHDKNYNRGYFSFFNEHRKELLYVLGRKKLGSWSKYAAVPHNFPGRFTPYFPINKEMYDRQKDSAMKKKKRSQLEQRWHIERDAALYFIKKLTKMPSKEIAKEINILLDHQVSEFSITRAIQRIRRKQNEDISDEDNE